MSGAPTQAALLELAARVEAASGSDRELDAAIALTLGLAGDNMLPDKYARGWCVGGTGQPHLSATYTASLDAAMTLVPEGYDWRVGHVNGGLTVYAECGGTGDDFVRFAAAPALALTAAAIRARAAQGDPA